MLEGKKKQELLNGKNCFSHRDMSFVDNIMSLLEKNNKKMLLGQMFAIKYPNVDMDLKN